jgi:hypothetical protein
MKKRFDFPAALLASCALAACSSGGGTVTGASPVTQAVTPTAAITSGIALNLQAAGTTVTYPAASNAATVSFSGGVGSILTTASGQGATVTLTADASGNLSKTVLNIPTPSGTLTQTSIASGPCTGCGLSSARSIDLGFTLQDTYTFPNEIGGNLSQLAGTQSLSWSAYGVWADTTAAFRGGSFAFGTLTPVGSVPTSGSATFAGTTMGQGGSSTAPYALQGSAQVTVNFSTHAVTTNLTNLATVNLSTNAKGSLPDLTGTATLSGNAYAGPIGGGALSGTINGNLYGPAAQETAGVWQATGGGNSWMGSYGAR